MLDVEICQRLKKAGFPQGETPEFPPPKKSDDVCTNFDSVWKHENGEWILLVRIEELLRELGKDFKYLENGGEGCWMVNDTGACTYESPETALANLYLALHSAK